MSLPETITSHINFLLDRAEHAEWRGWDPFDALASPLVSFLSFGSRWGRIAWIQLLKRSPLNLRPLLVVPKLQNPKALALFASTCWELVSLGAKHRQRMGQQLLDQLLQLRSLGVPGGGWGYPFDWQSRAFFAPRGTPNAVVTAFCGHALLDGFEQTGKDHYLQAAQQACDFLLLRLNRTPSESAFCFSYTPLDHSRIHNANLLAASLLCRVGRIIGRDTYRDIGITAASFSVARQQADGSWRYGEADNQRWVDHFHTGFNLVALNWIVRDTDYTPFVTARDRGLRFYLRCSFLDDGTPRYYDSYTWPIDIHSAAQAIITLSTFSTVSPEAALLKEKVLLWTLQHMIHPKTHRITYQQHPYHRITIPYLRWADAWMAKAFASYARVS